MEISRDFERLGQECLDLAENGRAVELLEQAYAWDANNGLALAELTLAHARLENHSAVRFYLELAEERAPRAPPRIYSVLGDIYYSLNRLEDAIRAWEQSERLGGDDPAILRRLARSREELSLSSHQSYREIGDFAFYYDAVIEPATVERIGNRLEEAARTISEFLRVALPKPQVVLLYAGRSYFALASMPDWVSGVFDGKIRVTMDPGGGFTPELETVLMHELAHACLRHATHDRAPGWLHEGLAQWLEGRRAPRLELRQAFQKASVRSLSEIDRTLLQKPQFGTARTNYLEALGIVEYLMQERGSGAVACLLQDLANGAGMDEALRRETGLSAEELVARWKAWAGL